MPRYVIVFPETPDEPAVPSDDLIRKVKHLVRRAIELGQSPEALDPELARYVVEDTSEFDHPAFQDPKVDAAWRRANGMNGTPQLPGLARYRVAITPASWPDDAQNGPVAPVHERDDPAAAPAENPWRRRKRE